MRLFLNAMLVIAIILLLYFLVATCAEGQVIIDSKGHLHGKRQAKTQQAKEIIDTVRMSSGVGYLVLQKEFTQNQHTTMPTAAGNIFCVITPVMTDTSDSVHSYATKLSSNRDTLVVRSTSNNDSGLVIVRAFIK